MFLKGTGPVDFVDERKSVDLDPYFESGCISYGYDT